jgi:hypothetical protein
MSIDVEQIEAKPRHIDAQTTVGFEALKGIWYPKVISGITEMFYKDDQGTETQVTTNGSLNLPTIPSLVPVGGGERAILGKTNANDHATKWYTQNELLREFFFVLPPASSIDQRVTALGSVAGLGMFSGDNDPSPTTEFGALPSTLVFAPVGFSDVIMTEVDCMELTSTGPAEDQGWKKLDVSSVMRSNIAKTKGALVNLNSLLNIAKPVFMRIRFIKTVMP